MKAPTGKLPTRRLVVVWPDGFDPSDSYARDEEATRQIRAFAAQLAAQGERPWFEVWYPAPAELDELEQTKFALAQADHFDAVEVDAEGIITPVPPYAELLGGVS